MNTPGKILIMDDDKPIRDLVSQLLSWLGYEVQSASDGTETLALYQSAKTSGQPFSAIILDLAIPHGIGGKKTVKMLQEIDPQVKVIISSGSTRDPAMLAYEQYGFCGVLPKPYSPEELRAVLQRVLHAGPTAS